MFLFLAVLLPLVLTASPATAGCGLFGGFAQRRAARMERRAAMSGSCYSGQYQAQSYGYHASVQSYGYGYGYAPPVMSCPNGTCARP